MNNDKNEEDDDDEVEIEKLLASCAASSKALAILLKLTAHAGCVDAMAQERCLLQAYWIAHRPPQPSDQVAALKLLHALSSTAAAAWAAATYAGVFYLAEVALPVAVEADEEGRAAQEVAKLGAVAVMGRLVAHPLHGPRVLLLLGKLLPPGLVAAIQVRFFFVFFFSRGTFFEAKKQHHLLYLYSYVSIVCCAGWSS